MSQSKRIALITGAGVRIGRQIAFDLAANDWPVAIHYNHSKDAADRVVDEIEASGGTAKAFQADLQREDEVNSLLPKVNHAFGAVGILINNAAVFEDDTISSVSRKSWDLHMETNLRAPLVLSQAFAKQLKDGKTGNIINILDQRVQKLTPQFLSYTLSKTALWTLTRTLAQALAPNIRVNGIGPGPTIQNKRQSEEDFAKQVNATLLKRATTPEEISQAVLYILSASAMTGQMIALDGGQHLIWQTPDVTGVVE